MKRFTVREFRYPEDSPLARLQELENKIEDGDLAEVIPSLDENLYRRINDLEKAFSSERQMAKFHKHKYLEARAGQEKNFGELEEAKRLLEKEYTKHSGWNSSVSPFLMHFIKLGKKSTRLKRRVLPMAENEQIEEMAKLACTVFEGRCSGCPFKPHPPCAPKASAERLYTAGYRKVERGSWERVGKNRFRCTACKSVLHLFAKFCPECGADMRSNKDDKKRKDQLL